MSAHVLQVLRQTSSKNEELIMLLQYGLPIWNQRAWHKVDQFHAILKAGGLPSLPNVIVSKAFRSNHTNKLNIAKNKYQNKTWYCLDHENRFYDTPLDQVRSWKSLDEEACLMFALNIPTNHFNPFVLKHLKEYTNNSDKKTPDDNTPTMDPTITAT